MTIELSSEERFFTLAIEVTGPLTPDDLTAIVSQLDTDTQVQKLSLEIATEDPTTLTLPSITQTDGSVTANQTDGEQIDHGSSTDGEDHPDSQSDASPQNTPRLHTGSDPFAIMRVIAHHDRWIRTQEIADAIPPDWDVSENALGSNLWNLEDRGLLDKRPYDDDNRQTEYHITDLGESALDQALDRADNPQPIQL